VRPLYNVSDVLEQLVLGAVFWGQPCMGGAHFGTGIPVLVVALTDTTTWTNPFGSASADGHSAQCRSHECQSFAFSAMAAVRTGDTNLPAKLAALLHQNRKFVALANPLCVPEGPQVYESAERIPACGNRVGAATTPGASLYDVLPVVSHYRASAAVCSGTLILPGDRSRISPVVFQVVMTGGPGVCAQNYADLAAMDPNLCSNTTLA
jgi:hypothetical protein